MLTGVFVIINFVWGFCMYFVWLDAALFSSIVKSGYVMTQLRGAFVMTLAAKWRTGMENRDLIMADNKRLNRQLHGSKKKSKAEVNMDMFVNAKGGGEWDGNSEGSQSIRLRERVGRRSSDEHV
jgi:hypothetical protein